MFVLKHLLLKHLRPYKIIAVIFGLFQGIRPKQLIDQ